MGASNYLGPQWTYREELPGGSSIAYPVPAIAEAGNSRHEENWENMGNVEAALAQARYNTRHNGDYNTPPPHDAWMENHSKSSGANRIRVGGKTGKEGRSQRAADYNREVWGL